MSKKQNRAKKSRKDLYIKNSWKAVIDKGACFFIQMDLKEDELAKKLLLFDDNDIEVADLQRQLAIQYQKLGKIQDAVSLMEKAMHTYWMKLEHDSPELITWEFAFAKMYMDADLNRDAAFILEGLLFVVERNNDPEYPSEEEILKLLAEAYQEEGMNIPAVEIFEELLASEAKNNTAKPTSIARRQLELAGIYREAGMTSAAVGLMNDSLENNLAHLEPHNKQVSDAKWELALNYNLLGCFKEAYELVDEVIAAELQRADFNRIQIARLLESQAGLCFQQGQWSRGKPRLLEAFKLYGMICGLDDENTKRVNRRLEEVG